MKKSYAGKILHRASQVVESLFSKGSQKGPKMISGGDLRSKPSKK